MPTRRALLIGIDAYPHASPLDGCVNDVDLMREILVGSFGFPETQVTRLLNERATRVGILSAIDALVAATGPDDIVVIHYAGHGSQMTDREGDEPSGFDSTIVPVDSARAPGENRDITDDEIHLKIGELGRKTAFTTLVFDACHSGTITRDAFGARARSIEPDRRPVTALPPSPIPGGRLSRTRSGTSGWMPLADKYVLIAGCRDEERSYEYRPPEGGGAVAHGALTYFLCQQLRQATSGTSYRDVFERAASRVNAENGEQHPQMEGQADREVFGVADLTPATFVRVAERKGATVVLAAGAAHGVTAGSVYQVHAQGARDPARDASLGAITITAVHAVTSDARVTHEEAPGTIGPNARAVESSHAYGDFRLAVQVVGAADGGEHIAALRQALEQSQRIKIAAEDSASAVRIYLLPARADVPPASPVPQAGALGAPRWAAVGATGDLVMPLKSPGDERGVVENLELIARHRQVLATENPDPGSRLRGRVGLDLLRRGANGTWAVAQPETDGGHIVFTEGDVVAFRITSRHDSPVHVALLDLGLSGAVSVVRQQERLGPHVTYDIGAEGDLVLGFPDGYPFVDSADHLREAAGVETLKLFVTQQPVDFEGLGQSGVRSAAPVSPLASLLGAALHGMATRFVAEAPVGREDWATAARSFVLRRRSTAPLVAGVPVSLGSATLVAPGVSGTVAMAFGRHGRDESARGVTEALQRALDQSGIETKQTLEISETRAVAPASRSADDPPAFELQLRPPEDGYGQLVMAVDELGVVTWCLPAAGPSTRRADGMRPTRTYVVPGGVASDAPQTPGSRGLVGAVGKKVLKELVFPLLDPVLGEVGATFVNRSERRWTPYRVRTFTPDDYTLEDAQTIDGDGWSRLASGRVLLMVHGTISRSHLAFHRLPREYVEQLHRLYGGRVLAFDHFTLSHDPKENVRRLLAQMPDDADLTLDIVSHSRGGLVSRVLAEKQGELELGARRLRIGKVVLVGAPSAGTALADPAQFGRVADVFTNLMNFLPDNGVTEVMTLVMSLLKQLAAGTFSGLDGLQAMQPDGPFTRWLNTGARTGDTRYFAVASKVTPVDPGFPIDDTLVLEGDDAAAHTTYFADPRVRRQLLDWLGRS